MKIAVKSCLQWREDDLFSLYVLRFDKMMDQLTLSVTEQLKQKKLQALIDEISNRHFIEVSDVNQRDFSRFTVIAPTVSIVNGHIYTSPNPFASLVLHEMCHILSVEPEYRHHMDGDTIQSYAKINKMNSFGREYRTESATIGLQNEICKEYGITVRISGEFYEGPLGVETRAPSKWISKGQDLYRELGFDRIRVNMPSYKIYDTHKIEDNSNSSEVFVELDNKSVIRSFFFDKTYYNAVTRNEIDTSKISRVGIVT